MRRLFLLLVLLPLYAQSQTVKDIVQRHWKCVYTAHPAFGEVDTIIQQLYSIEVRASGNYTGMCGTTVISKGKKYSGICRINGKLIVKKKRKEVFLTYSEGEVIRQDQLPDNGRWCNEHGILYVYRDKEKPGEYFLEGDISCDGSSGSTKIFR